MYSIFIRNMTVVNSEELCIYSDETVEDKFKLESADLKLQEGNAGSLTFRMPQINVGYEEIETLATQVIVRKDGAVYWFGRVIEVKIDYNNNKEIVTEGAFNYLMDTIQTPYHASASISTWITHLIEAHNAIVAAANETWKQVVVGYIDPNINPSTNTDLYTNYETTLDMINNACQGWEAHPLFTYQVDSTTKFPRLVLNFYKTYYLDGDGIPEIAFGENLSDYTKEIKNEDVATVIIPVGKEYDDTERATIQQQWTDHPSDPTQWTEPKPDTDISDLDWRRTVYSVNSQSIYLYDTQANLNRYGYNCKIVEFNEVIDPTELKAAGEKYLRDQKWDKLTLTLSAYDLSLLDYNLSPIKMGGLVHCLSKPHGLDYNYPCTAIDENLLDATATTYTLGTADNSYLSDSSRQTDQKLRDAVTQAVAREKIIQQNSYTYTNSSVTDIYNELEEEIQAITFDPSEAVEEAKTNALQLLNIYDEEKNPERKGYVHFVKETADYSSEGILTFSELKARINKYDASHAGTQTFLNNVENWLANPVNSSGWTFVVCVALGEEDYQTNVAVYECPSSYNRGDNHMPYLLNTSPYKIFTSYNENYVAYVAKYQRYTSTGTPGVVTNSFNTISRSTASRDDGSDLWDSNNKILVPNEFYFNNPALKFYCSVNVYESSSSNDIKYPAAFIQDPASDSLSLAQLKGYITSHCAASTNLTNILNQLDANINNADLPDPIPYEHLLIYVQVKKDNGVLDWDHFVLALFDVAHTTYHYFTHNGSTSGLAYTYGSNNSIGNNVRIGSQIRVNGEYTPKVQYVSMATTSVTINPSTTIDWSTRYETNSAVFGPSLAAYNDTNSEVFVSMPIHKSPTGADVFPRNLVEHITNPQDHITEIVISDKADYMANDANLWRWNKEGLYYLNGGYNSDTLTPNTETHEGYQSVDDRLRLALTKDGSIVADRITAGKLDAGIIRTGLIQSQNDNGSALQIAMDTGTILAKKARIVFANAREHADTPALPDQALNEFAYFSNEPLNRWMNVSGQTSKDWMLVVGSSFGVDKFGRTFMREGHIGGVGGAFDIKAYNDQPIAPRYGSTPIDVGTPIYYEVSISSDAYRPDPIDPVPAQCKFFFRLGYYSASNTITCVTNIEGFVFEAGTAPEEYEFIFETQEAGVYPYYPGELFPVWYTEGTSTDYDYEEDGEYYKQQTGVNSSYVIEITGYYDSDQETPTMPQYKSWTEERITTSTQNKGTIHIGTGYLDNGNIGQNQSFFLGGITRSGYVAGYSKSNWRFTVGSRFGVDEDGRMYCTGAFLDDIQARGSVVAYSANFNTITNMNLRASTSLDTQPQYVRLKWRLHNTGGYTTEGDTGIFTTKTAFSILVDQGDPAAYRPASDMSYSPNLTFKVSEVVIDSAHGTPLDPIPRGTFSFSYNKLGTDPQVIIIDTSAWDDTPQGSPMTPTGEIDIEVEMSNENTNTMVLHSSTQFKHWPTEGGATDTMYYGEGYMIFKNVTEYEKPAVHVNAEYFTGNKLGGPNERWQEGWINSLTYTTPPSGSSSKFYKHDIEGLDSRYDKLLDILRPVRFRFNKDHYDDGGLYHAGFILEELKDNMDIAGIKPEEFGAYDPNPNGGGGIRYSEFIPLIVDQLQKLKRENEDLKRQLYEKGILDD